MLLLFFLLADTQLSVWIRGCVTGDIPRSWDTIQVRNSTDPVDHLPDHLQRFEPGRRCHVGLW